MEYISNLISLLLLKKHVISEDDFDIYKFGILILLYKFIFIFSVYSICLLSGKSYIVETTVFLIIFFFIREYSGGYHANSEKICFLIFLVIYIAFRFLLDFFSLNTFVCLIISVISSLYIYIKAPIDCENKRLSVYEKEKYKGIVKNRLIGIDIIMCFLSFASFSSLLYSFFYAKIVILLLMKEK